jgi:alkanesulfonate monooxygenase SsuD/methylene tetrahydromethanopterin reductase-like flavin-dependent oxidoreductase (luciferase family)
MTMPVMEPDLDAEVLRDWARAIDDGPFSSLCWGERMAFDNPETLTLMGALAAWTDRVRRVTTVMVPQLHDPVMLAKADVTYRWIRCPRLDARPMRGRQYARTDPSAPRYAIRGRLSHRGPIPRTSS